MSILRLGTPETEREGVVLEVTNGDRRVTIRGWHGGGTGGGVHLIRPRHFSIAEIAAFLGLLMPAPGTRKRQEAAPSLPGVDITMIEKAKEATAKK